MEKSGRNRLEKKSKNTVWRAWAALVGPGNSMEVSEQAGDWRGK